MSPFGSRESKHVCRSCSLHATCAGTLGHGSFHVLVYVLCAGMQTSAGHMPDTMHALLLFKQPFHNGSRLHSHVV